MINDDTRHCVFQRDGYTCRFCGHVGNAVTLEVDHSVPVAQGGTDHGNNLQTACWPCNALKSDRKTKAFDAWLRYNFASRAHYARYTAAARANGRLPNVDRWLGNNPPSLVDRLFKDWSLPAPHAGRWGGSGL